jgi:hypothetical protein
VCGGKTWQNGYGWQCAKLCGYFEYSARTLRDMQYGQALGKNPPWWKRILYSISGRMF